MQHKITNQNTNGYENVRVAIIEQAITDYKRALKKRQRGSIISLERFFLSSWGEMISGGNGEYIIEQVKKQIREGATNGRK